MFKLNQLTVKVLKKFITNDNMLGFQSLSLNLLALYLLSLNKNIAKRLYILVPIIWIVRGAALPQVLSLMGVPPVPNPILESQLSQLIIPSLATRPILAFDALKWLQTTLNPSLLQKLCKDASAPISDFHVLRPSEVLRYCPSAISEYRELACLLMTVNLLCCPIFIPRQTLENGVFQ